MSKGEIPVIADFIKFVNAETSTASEPVSSEALCAEIAQWINLIISTKVWQKQTSEGCSHILHCFSSHEMQVPADQRISSDNSTSLCNLCGKMIATFPNLKFAYSRSLCAMKP